MLAVCTGVRGQDGYQLVDERTGLAEQGFELSFGDDMNSNGTANSHSFGHGVFFKTTQGSHKTPMVFVIAVTSV
jgi:hypothetical protein